VTSQLLGGLGCPLPHTDTTLLPRNQHFSLWVRLCPPRPPLWATPPHRDPPHMTVPWPQPTFLRGHSSASWALIPYPHPTWPPAPLALRRTHSENREGKEEKERPTGKAKFESNFKKTCFHHGGTRKGFFMNTLASNICRVLTVWPGTVLSTSCI
jgi:hypothetical protein